MNRDLNILISAKLNDSALTDINKQIEIIQDKVKAINVDVKLNVDNKALSDFEGKIKDTQKRIGDSAKTVKIIDNKSYQDDIDNFVKTYQKAFNDIKKSNPDATVTSKTFIDPSTDKINAFSIQIKQLNGEMQDLYYNLVKVQNASGKGNFQMFRLSNQTNVDATMPLDSRVQEQQAKLIADAQKLQRQNTNYTPPVLDDYLQRVNNGANLQNMEDVKAFQQEFVLIKELTNALDDMQAVINKIRSTDILPPNIDALENVVKTATSPDQIAGIQTQLDAMQALHKEMVSVEQERAKLLANVNENLNPQVIGQDEFSSVLNMANSAKTVTELTQAKNLYAEILDLQKQEIKNEQDLTKEIQKSIDAQIKANQAENKRQLGLGEVVSASPASGTPVNIPASAYDSMSNMRQFVANTYGVDASVVSLTRSIQNGDKEVYKFQVDLKTSADTFDRISGAVDKATNSIYKFSEQSRNTPNRNLGYMEQIQNNFKRIPSMMISQAAFTIPQQAIHDLTQNILALDTQMNQLKRAMQDTQPGTDFSQMMQSSINMANQFGAKIDDVSKIMVGFANSGRFTAQQVMELTRIATIASNITGMSGDQSSNALHTIMNSFQLTDINQVMDVVDKMSNVSRNFAINSTDIAEGLAKSGAAAKTYGVDIDQLVGYMTAIAQTTRESGNVIGNALKTIFSRFDSKPAVSALHEVGVEVQNVDGSVRTVGDVINDLAGKWNTLTSAQQEHIAVSVAGRYQLTRFLALMNDFQVAQRAMSDSMYASGSAMQENNIYNESMQSSINKLSTAWMNLAKSTSGVSVGFNAILSVITAIINGFSVMGSGIGSIVIGVTAVTFAVIALSRAFQTVRASIEAAKLAGEEFKLSLGWIGAILIGIDLITSGIAGYTQQQGGQQSTNDLFSQAQESQAKSDQLNSLIDQYVQLSSTTVKTTKTQTDLNNIILEIQRIQPAVADALTNTSNSLEQNAKSAKTAADAYKTLSQEQLANAKVQNDSQIASLTAQIAKAQADVANSKAQQQKELDSLNQMTQSLGAKTFDEAQTKLQQQHDANPNDMGINGNLVAFEMLISDVSSKNGYLNNLTNLNNLKSQRDEAQKTQLAIQEAINGNMKYATSLHQTADAVGSTTQSIAQNSQALGANAQSTGADASSMGALGQSAADATQQIDPLTKSINDLIDNQGLDQFSATLQGTLQQFGKDYDSNKASLQDYNKLLSDMANGKQLNADEALSLIAKEGDLATAISIENGQVVVNQKAVQALRDAKIQAYIDSMNIQNAQMISEETALQKTLNSYGLQIQGLNTLAQVKIAQSQLDQKLAGMSPDEAEQYHAAYEQLKQLADYYTKIQQLQDLAKSGFTQAGIDSTAQQNKQAKDSVDALTMALDSLNVKIQAQQDLLNQFPKSSQAYRDALQEQINLIKQKDQLIQNELDHPTVYTLGNPDSSSKPDVTVPFKGGASGSSDVISYINKYAQGANINASLIKAIAQQESSLGENSSNVMQVEGYNGNVEGSIQAGVDHFKNDLAKAGNDVQKALAAYNMGDEILNWFDQYSGGHFSQGVVNRFSDVYSKQYNDGQGWGDKGYVEKVMSYFNQFQSDSSNTDNNNSNSNSSTSTDQATTAGLTNTSKQIYDAQNKLKTDLTNDAKQITALQKQIFDSFLAVYDDEINKLDEKMKISSIVQGQTVKGTDDYNNLTKEQISILQQKQDQLHKEADAIRNSGYNTDEYNNKLKQLSQTWFDLQSQIDTKKLDEVNNIMDSFNGTIANNTSQIDMSKARASALDTNTSLGTNYDNLKKYNDELVTQETLYKENANLVQQQIDAIQQQLQLGDLNASQVDTLNQKIKDLTKTRQDDLDNATQINSELKKQQESLAQDIVSIMKDQLTQERDLKLQAIDDQMKKEQETHDDTIKKLEEEKKVYDNVISEQEKAINRQDATDNYNIDLAQKEKNRQLIQDQLNNLSLDTSAEAVTKKKDLNKQLDQIDADIAKTKRDRDKQLRLDNLNDQKTAYDTGVDDQKQALDQQLANTKDTYDQQKTAITKSYDDQINDTQHWNQITLDIINGHYDKIQETLGKFKIFYTNSITQLGQITESNLVAQIDQAIQKMNVLSNYTPSSVDSSTTAQASQSTVLSLGDGLNAGEYQLTSDGMTGIAGARELATQFSKVTGITDFNDNKNITYDEKSNTVNINGHQFRSLGNVNDRNLISVRDFAEAFHLQLKWDNANQTISLYHDGGIIGDKSSSTLTQIANRMFNTSADEQVVKALKGELMIPESNIAKNFVPNIGRLVSQIGASTSIQSGDTNYNVQINIDKISNKSEADYATKRMVDELKKIGRVVRQ